MTHILKKIIRPSKMKWTNCRARMSKLSLINRHDACITTNGIILKQLR